MRCFEGNKRPEGEAMLQRLEERDLLPASDDDAIASRRVDRRVFEVIRRIRSGAAFKHRRDPGPSTTGR